MNIRKTNALSAIIVVILISLSTPTLINSQTSSEVGPISQDARVIAGEIEYIPTIFAAPVYDAKTMEFVGSTRSVPENNATSVEQIFFRLATLRILDPDLSNLTVPVKSFWISQILSFQRSSGGFGHWKDDRSSVSSTHMALQSLDWLGHSSLNTTLVKSYLDNLQNSLTDGFNSYLLDTDSDVHATYLAVKSYSLIGESPSNVTAVAEYFKRAQNPDGGFGMQTNNEKGVYWTSEATVTEDAILGLDLLSDASNDPGAALDFVRGLQLISDGGFANDLSTPTSSSAYSASALSTIDFFADTPVNATSAEEYILSLEEPDGSFRLTSTSAGGSLKGIYLSVLALDKLGKAPTNILDTVDYILNIPTTDGFGGSPGDEASLRETFDAVYSYVLTDTALTNAQGIVDYVASYRNLDGGYGISGSYTESTLRAVEIHNLLDVTFPDPATTIAFLRSLQLPNGGFVKTSTDSTAYIVSTYRASRALQLLGSQPSNVAGAVAFVQGIQNGDGGFGGFLGDTSDVTNTYRAVSTLSILGSAPTNISGAIAFLRNSQNPDGGFRRSVLDTVLPKNISNSIYSYSAMRALNILNSEPLNLTALYMFIKTTQNFDGGYAEHPQFTSDNSYTFVSLYLLRNFHIFSGFKMAIPDDLSTTRSNYENFSVSILVTMGDLTYNITNTNTSEMELGVFQSSNQLVINTAGLENGTYLFQALIEDGTGAKIAATFQVLIDAPSETSTSAATTTTSTTSTTTSDTTTSSTSNTDLTNPSNNEEPLDQGIMLMVLGGGIALILFAAVYQKRRTK